MKFKKLNLSGTSGSPVLMGDSGDIAWSDPHKDVVVGIVSFANYSALKDSGVGCVRMATIHSWVMQTISPQVHKGPTGLCTIGV